MAIAPARIDYAFRPTDTFFAHHHGIRLLSDIKGTQRRRAAERAMLEGAPEAVLSDLVRPALDEHERTRVGAIHPALMGGEYLPDTASGEVEVARIAIASVTGDATCVYARREGKRFVYRVVDEYDGDTLGPPTERASARPLSLRQLVTLFLDAYNVLDLLRVNFVENGIAPEEARGFITDASSPFYPQFGPAIGRRVENWIARQLRAQRRQERLDRLAEQGDLRT